MSKENPNLYHDLIKSDKIISKVQDEQYALKLYAAMCNVKWKPTDLFKYIKGDTWSTSWRSAGGIVAELRNQGEDYLSFYCGGNEGFVDDEIKSDLRELGWVPEYYDDEEYL